MEPQNQENSVVQDPLPTDYLDQIAPQTSPKGNFFSKKIVIIGLIGAALLAVILIIIGSSSSGSDIKPSEKLYAKLKTTQAVEESAIKSIKNSDLRAINADLKSFLTDTLRDIETPLAKVGSPIKSITKQTLASEANQAMVDKLENARLNAVFDRIYPSEMAYQLDTILTLMNKILKTTSSKDMKTFLTEAIKNLTTIQERFENFSSTTS